MPEHFDETYDVVVVGGGHAGCEAAMACARMGLRTALYTINLDLIAQMSCNPAVGGIAKGHLTREVDAIGGVMGEVIDHTGIQFRLLNTSRGPAVWSPRAQADKKLYRQRMRQVLESEPNLVIKQAEVASLIVENLRGPATESEPRLVRGMVLRDGRRVGAQAAIITTGTFLNGLIHVGETTYPAGRSGEPPAQLLGEALKLLGLRWGRLKTGTPPRLDGCTIDFSQFQEQPGDPEPTPFSFRTRAITQPQTICWFSYTNQETHRILRENLHRSPLYSGQIKALGPRYCPSIEDKIVKFPDKERHQIFLEPEGLDTHEIYVNGMSTSMPIDVQMRVVRSIPGLARADMIRPGYAIEYDFIDPTELDPSLETKKIQGLFLAGQINGTSGYEEAACQGIMAGINAGLKLGGKPPLVLPRTEAYTGILIDDLVTKGTTEPYRMFTSRAEFRLHLRIDNADQRLTPLGYAAGLIREADWQAFLARQERIQAITDFLLNHRITGDSPLKMSLTQKLGTEAGVEGATLGQLLKRPEVRIEDFRSLLEQAIPHALSASCPAWVRSELKAAETAIKYEGYLVQQQKQIERIKRAETRRIPEWFDYRRVSGLSREVVEKLTRVRPATLGQASRIPGITPAAVNIIHVYLELARRPSAPASA